MSRNGPRPDLCRLYSSGPKGISVHAGLVSLGVSFFLRPWETAVANKNIPIYREIDPHGVKGPSLGDLNGFHQKFYARVLKKVTQSIISGTFLDPSTVYWKIDSESSRARGIIHEAFIWIYFF